MIFHAYAKGKHGDRRSPDKADNAPVSKKRLNLDSDRKWIWKKFLITFAESPCARAVSHVVIAIGFWGRCPGCNPPSVLSSICLIGEPAPPAEDHWRLLPLSHRCRDPFHPQFPAIPRRSPGEGMSSSSWTGQGLVSAPPHRLSPGISYDHNGLRYVGGVSSRPPSMVL